MVLIGKGFILVGAANWAILLICSGDSAAQPPIILAPESISDFHEFEAICSGVSGKNGLPIFINGAPALA
jgi:hypothetical protein